LYKNVIKLRFALAAYTRTMQPMVMNASEPVIRGFLDTYAFHKEAPNVAGALSRFRARVILIQTWFRQLRMIRFAYISLFRPYWQQSLKRMYKELAHQWATQAAALSQAEADAKQAALAGKSMGSIISPAENFSAMEADGSKRFSWLNSLMKRCRSERTSGLIIPEAKQTSVKEWQDILEAKMMEDPIPDWLATKLLYDYIREMQRTKANRVKKWEEQVSSARWAKDLEGFGVKDDKLKGTDYHTLSSKKPRSVYVDTAELDVLVREKIDLWGKGAFKHIKMRRILIQRTPFKFWARAAKAFKQRRVPVRTGERAKEASAGAAGAHSGLKEASAAAAKEASAGAAKEASAGTAANSYEQAEPGS
jgi:hypothetical protein